MKNKILALAFVCSFVAVNQAAVAGACGEGCQSPYDPQQPCQESVGQYVMMKGKGFTLGDGECFYRCHCQPDRNCVGADVEHKDKDGKPDPKVGRCEGPKVNP